MPKRRRRDSVSAKIGGRKWRIDFASPTIRRLRGLWGISYQRNRRIHVSRAGPILSTVIHEALHASMPYLDESEVERVEADITAALAATLPLLLLRGIHESPAMRSRTRAAKSAVRGQVPNAADRNRKHCNRK